eukprot:g8740.t1
MSDEDVIDRMNDFLKSAEWKHTVSTFIDSHCHFFTHDDGDDIDVNMYEIYKNFCDIVDGLLGMSLQEIGSSEEEFVDMLADKMRQPDVGPRDKAMKEMLTSLMTFENFQDFRIMMADKAASKHNFASQHGPTANHRKKKNDNSGDNETKMGDNTNNNKNDDVWACYQCTYINEIRFATCQICGAIGPDNIKSKATPVSFDKNTARSGSSKTRDIDDIIEDLERQKKICRRSQFRIPNILMNKLYDLIQTNPNPSNKDVVKIFQSHSDVNTLMTNPSQVTNLVAELRKLNSLEKELLLCTTSSNSDDNNNNNQSHYTSHVPSKPTKPSIQSDVTTINNNGTLHSPDPHELKKAIERSKYDEESRQLAFTKDAEREAQELELAMQLSLLEAEKLKVRLAKQGLWDMTDFPSSPSPSHKKASSSNDKSYGKAEQELKEMEMQIKLAQQQQEQAKMLEKQQEQHKKMLEQRQADLDKLKEEKMQQELLVENERLEKAKHLGEIEQLKLKEKEHIQRTAQALKSLEDNKKKFEQHAEQTHQAILEIEMKETRLQIEKADLEQKLVVERLEKEQHCKNHLNQIEQTKELENKLQIENQKRIELEEQLKRIQQGLESKVNETAENARIKQQELEKKLNESNFKAHKIADEMERRLAQERQALELVRKEAAEKSKHMEHHEKQSQVLKRALDEEELKRIELEDKLNALKQELESKVTHTAENAEMERLKLQALLDDSNATAEKLRKGMEQQLQIERENLEKVKMQALKDREEAETQQYLNNNLQKQLEVEGAKRSELQAALQNLKNELESKVTSTAELAKEKQYELISKLKESDRKAQEIRDEMEERIQKEREQLERTKQELHEKDSVINQHLNNNVKLSSELQNEQNRRLELEKQLELLKIDSESKITSTAEWAQEQGQKLKKELDKIKAKQRKRNEKVNQRMKMLLQALKDEEKKSNELNNSLNNLRTNFQKKSNTENEAKLELAKQETKYILEMQKARQKTEEIRRELSEQLQRQREAALQAVETSKNMVVERDRHREEAEAHRRKFNEEQRKNAELAKQLESKQSESQRKAAESERLKNELAEKDNMLQQEMAKREELLKRLTEFEKGQAMLAKQHATLAQRHANTMNRNAKRSSNIEKVMQIRDEFHKESEQLKGKLLQDQQTHREKIKERLQQKRNTMANGRGGGMGEVNKRIQVQSMRVVDFTSDDDD